MFQLSHVCSGMVGGGAVLAAVLLSGASPSAKPDTIDVGRINIREPDGTLRMVLSSAALAPGIVIDGHEQPHPDRRSAGMLFYNEEGTENGGLIFDGKRDAAGARHSSGSLTFDRYKQDQVVQLVASEDGAARSSGLVVNDHPDQEMDFSAIDRVEKLPASQRAAAYRAAHFATTRRVFVGRSEDGASQLVLKDAAGSDRLVLKVDAAGAASIAFLDVKGRVTRTFGPQ